MIRQPKQDTISSPFPLIPAGSLAPHILTLIYFWWRASFSPLWLTNSCLPIRSAIRIPGTAAVILGGPWLFLLGNLLFQRIVTGSIPVPFLTGLIAIALLFPFTSVLSALVLSLLTVIVQSGFSAYNPLKASQKVNVA